MAVLTDRKAQALKFTDDALAHGGVVGLTLVPLKTKGHGQWKLRYVSPVTNKRRTMGLGSYPVVSIAEAGQKGFEARQLIARGVDPLEVVKEELVTPSFERAARTLYRELLPGWKNAKHADQWINTLTVYIFPKLGAMSVDSLKPADFAGVLKPIWLDKAETASRVKQRCHAVMAWAWAHGYIVANPLDVVDKLLPVQRAVRAHQPAMPWKLLPEFLNKYLQEYTFGETTRPLLMFLILTACRSGEVRAAEWKEIDFQSAVWTIPAKRMKAGIQHRVPLSSHALQILDKQKGLHENLIFPSPRGLIPSDMILTAFLRRCNAPSDIADRSATAHGFRSSFRDWASENGYRRDLAERALAHSVQNQVEAAYHRTDLLEERSAMMNAWSDFLIQE